MSHALMQDVTGYRSGILLNLSSLCRALELTGLWNCHGTRIIEIPESQDAEVTFRDEDAGKWPRALGLLSVAPNIQSPSPEFLAKV